MVLLREFRVPMPISGEEYKIGMKYCVARTQMDVTKDGGEGIELLENTTYTDEKTGETGYYTHKIYHLGSYVPGWMRSIIPTSALQLEEKAWELYPYCKTEVSSPFMGEKFLFTIVTLHADDCGEQENIHNLDEETLKKRDVEFLDILTPMQDKKYYREDEDPSLVKCEKRNRGPLTPGWYKTMKPLICAYKLVTVKCSGRVESFLMNMEQQIFLRYHKQCYTWLDEYVDMSMEDVMKIENTMYEKMLKIMDKKN